MILAGIDIGTNSIRLLVADVSGTTFHELQSARTITRLGQDLERTSAISDGAWSRSLLVLQEFSDIINKHQTLQTVAVGTSALRRAANSSAFIAEVQQRTGIRIRIISGEEEALLTLRGVKHALSPRGDLSQDPLLSSLIFDIGGGSTELIVTRDGAIAAAESLHLGAVYLTDRFLKHVPPLPGEIDALVSLIRKELDAWEDRMLERTGMRPEAVEILAGTAGTITTLASMDLNMTDYDPLRINGYTLTKAALDRMVHELSAASPEERHTIIGLESGREDIILAGALVAKGIMDRCGKDELLVSDWGLREGIVFDLFDRCSGRV